MRRDGWRAGRIGQLKGRRRRSPSAGAVERGEDLTCRYATSEFVKRVHVLTRYEVLKRPLSFAGEQIVSGC